MAAASPTQEQCFKTGISKIFTSEKFSDFTIKCGPHEFKVHKAIICAQSGYFEVAAGNSFKESATNTITLDTSDPDDPSCDDPDAVKRMIHFFYHFTYSVQKLDLVPPSTNSKNDGNALAHAQVFAAAVKYQVPALQVIAAKKFKLAVESNSGHPSFAQAITTAYTTTPGEVRELRDILGEKLAGIVELLGRKDIRIAVSSVNGLLLELVCKLQTSAAKFVPLKIKCHKCRSVVSASEDFVCPFCSVKVTTFAIEQ